MRLIAAVEGGVVVQSGTSEERLDRGETLLIPAAAGELQISPQHSDAETLEITLS